MSTASIPCAVLVGAAEASSGRIVGLAEAQPTNRLHAVELAVSVHPAWRGCRLGQRLLGQVIAIAFARGAETAEFHFDPADRTVVRIVRALGARAGPMQDWAEIPRPALCKAA